MPSEGATVLRSWTGWIRTTDCEAYARYLDETGLRQYRATEGNRGAWAVMRDVDEGRTEVRTLSLWQSRDDIIAFAGAAIVATGFYPDDDRFLLDHDRSFMSHDRI